MEKSRMNLPKGPDTLCFDKDEFMKVRPGGCAPRAEAGGLSSFPSEASSSCWARTPGINPRRDLAAFAEDFDVDHFVSDCPKQVQLEALRDDLELYYKLKTAMVELINKDYADFVNLSTNLVILEQIVDSRLSDLQLMYDKLLEFVPHHCRLLREVTGGAISRFREIAGSLEAALTDVLEDAPAGSLYHLLASHRTWSSLRRCWSDKMFLPLLAHRLWRLTLQIWHGTPYLSRRWKHFIAEILFQPLLRPISNESAKDVKKPLDFAKTKRVALLKQSPSSPLPALSLSVWSQTWTGFRSSSRTLRNNQAKM
ncbi:conserved oligomeric Golgi complex subunit 2-like isoform X1 [Cervus elaphus]|uniref:conserved oligomeric Golgi complex subunit 2-like isoform X1 n=1 Tax=Cervus elaphus TaxID=9860 RepID=UPI001CC2B38E|nr:conserved oligomeric Golgi complex subunit 2-like isoform X1 [Cervus elaphus]